MGSLKDGGIDSRRVSNGFSTSQSLDDQSACKLDRILEKAVHFNQKPQIQKTRDSVPVSYTGTKTQDNTRGDW